jgi:Domain of unknown function (DUF1963)
VGISDSTSAAAELVAVAQATLPSAVAERWIGLLRPAIRLRRAEPAERPVAQLGGSPALPDGVAWPRSEAGQPLGFVASIDFGQLPVGQLDVPLPAEGTLLLFYRDPLEDMPEGVQGVAGPLPDLQPPEARLLHVPAGVAATARTAPPGAATYRAVPLAGEQIVTGPDWEHPALARAVAGLSDADRAFMADPFNSDPFRIEMGDKIDHPRHRVGGYANPVQGSVEVDVAHQRLGGRVSYSDPALHDQARQWTSIVQIDSDDDAGMMWGDCGCLYWLMRPADIAARRFDASEFTFQCS